MVSMSAMLSPFFWRDGTALACKMTPETGARASSMSLPKLVGDKAAFHALLRCKMPAPLDKTSPTPVDAADSKSLPAGLSQETLKCDNRIVPMVTSSTPAFSPETIRQHGLTPEEYEKIRQLLGGREPTLTELGIFSVMWSEHCSYKSSRVHLKRLPTRSKLVVQGPGENAGIIDIGDGWACAFKIESHNHPSFIEPLQGAATGVGGILRDIFTMGARPVAIMDSLRFGPLNPPKVAPGTMASDDEQEIRRNHSILSGVVSGIAHYGNCFGVPNLGGETKF